MQINKFNGKELDTETGLAYYGARYYSPELSVWYGVDPLMEKYPQNGEYVFCNANPVKFVDMDGRKFTESSEKIVKDFKEHSQTLKDVYISKINNLVSKGKGDGFKANLFKGYVDEINEGMSELSVLENSDQLYHINPNFSSSNSDIDYKGSVTYDFDQDAVSINIGNPKDFISIAHELKHAYQFEVGELSFGSNGEGGYLYNIEDEIVAYKRGAAYGGNVYEYGTYEILEKDKSPIKGINLRNETYFNQFNNYLGKKGKYNVYRYENKTYK